MFEKCPTRTFSEQIGGYLNATCGKVRISWYLNCYVRAIRTTNTCDLCQSRLSAADHAVSYLAYGTYLYLHIFGFTLANLRLAASKRRTFNIF